MRDNFSPFDFFREVIRGEAPSELERQAFDLYSTQALLSMSDNPQIASCALMTNTKSFFKLPPKFQADAFTALAYKTKMPKWKRGKKSASDQESIEKLCKLFNMSENSVRDAIRHKTVDVKKSEALYEEIYG
jgi:hypothetical protein